VKPMTKHQGAPTGNLTPFAFQQLAVYIAARELAAGVHQAVIGDPELRDQATRAAKSVFLNIAEGLPETGLGVRRRHFTIARNSLCEVAAAIDLAVVIGALPEAVGVSLAVVMQRVGACLRGLLRA
jgi:four helix bundle protein